VTAHVQKRDFVFRRKGRVHLNRQGRQFNRLLAAEVCASAVVMLDAPSSEVLEMICGVKGTGYPLHSSVSPSFPLPCVTLCHHISTGLYGRNTASVFRPHYRLCWYGVLRRHCHNDLAGVLFFFPPRNAG